MPQRVAAATPWLSGPSWDAERDIRPPAPPVAPPRPLVEDEKPRPKRRRCKQMFWPWLKARRNRKESAPRKLRPEPRARSIGNKPLTRRERAEHQKLVRELTRAGAYESLPRVREDCPAPGEPCPKVGCRHHRYLEVDEVTGAIKINFPDIAPWELRDPCTLHIAIEHEDEGLHLGEVGAFLNLTMERARQLEKDGLRNMLRLLEPRVSPAEMARMRAFVARRLRDDDEQS